MTLPRFTGFSEFANRVKQFCVGVVCALVFGPLLIAIVSLLGFDERGWFAATISSFTPDRVDTIGRIVVRGVVVASVAAIAALPIGIRLGTLTRPRLAAAATVILITPYFVNDSIKGYAWADILIWLRQCIALLPIYFAPRLAELASPYSSYAPSIPLFAATIPLVALTVFIGYGRTVRKKKRFFDEITPNRSRTFFLVTLPLIAPYILAGWLLAFGLVVCSSAEEQYLGNGLPNNLQTLMASLLRTDIDATLIFGLLTIFMAATIAFFVAWATAAGSSYRLFRVVMKPFFVILRVLQRMASRSTTRVERPGERRSIANLYTTGIIAITWLPIILVLARGVFSCSQISCWPSASIIVNALGTPRTSAALYVTLVVGTWVAAGGIAIAIAAIWLSVANRVDALIVFTVLFCLLVPAQTVSIALGQAVRSFNIEGGSLALVVVAQIVLIFPFCTMFAAAFGRSLPIRSFMTLEEFGKRAPGVIRLLTARYGAPALASSAVFAFVLSANDGVRLSYLGGTREGLSSLVAASLYAGQIHSSSTPYGLSAALLLLGIAGVILSGIFGRRVFQQR